MISESVTMAGRHLTKWLRNPFAVTVNAMQALFWLALFGNSFNPANSLPGGAPNGSLGILSSTFSNAPNYITFLTPGIIGIVALTGMSFMGVDLVLDRLNGQLGVLQTYPVPRSSIYFGGVLQNVAKGLVQVPVTLAIALLVPNGLRVGAGFGILNLLALAGIVTLLVVVFAALFTGIAILLKSTDSFFAIVNFLAFPIMFTSTALFPGGLFSGWLKPVAQVNPISLAVDGARLALVQGSLSTAQWSQFATDVAGLLVYLALFVGLGTVMARKALKPE